jgi:hypothetical protein
VQKNETLDLCVLVYTYTKNDLRYFRFFCPKVENGWYCLFSIENAKVQC